VIAEQRAVVIPGHDAPISLELPPRLAALRQEAVDLHQQSWGAFTFVERPLLEAAAWAAHTDDEDWLIWQARKFAAVATGMPIRLREGELMSGTPDLRAPTEAEGAAMEKAYKEMEDRPPWPGGDGGHFHPDYAKIFRLGVGGMLDEIGRRRAADGLTDEQKTFYDACRIAMEAFRHYVRRVAGACRRRADEPDADAAHWRRLAGTCEHVAHGPPETFEQACQLMYLVMVVSWYCEGHVMTCYGRMDRTLLPLYEADTAAGRLTGQEAMERIACLYILQNMVCPPGLANGVVVTGALLILWSLMPFAKYLPGDYGTARVQAGLLDTGTAMLRFYDFAQARMGGGRPFLLEPEPVVTDPNGNGRPDEAGDEFADYNRNGQWDRGWLWRYQRHGTVLPDHIEHLVEGAEGG